MKAANSYTMVEKTLVLNTLSAYHYQKVSFTTITKLSDFKERNFYE